MDQLNRKKPAKLLVYQAFSLIIALQIKKIYRTALYQDFPGGIYAHDWQGSGELRVYSLQP